MQKQKRQNDQHAGGKLYGPHRNARAAFLRRDIGIQVAAQLLSEQKNEQSAVESEPEPGRHNDRRMGKRW